MDPYVSTDVSHAAALALRQLQTELANAHDTIEALQVCLFGALSGAATLYTSSSQSSQYCATDLMRPAIAALQTMLPPQCLLLAGCRWLISIRPRFWPYVKLWHTGSSTCISGSYMQ